jgi:hypothetical protein
MSSDSWLNRVASPEAGRVDALERTLANRYPDAAIVVSASRRSAQVSIARDGRPWLTLRVDGDSLAAALDQRERAVSGLIS